MMAEKELPKGEDSHIQYAQRVQNLMALLQQAEEELDALTTGEGDEQTEIANRLNLLRSSHQILNESERRFHAIFDNALDGVMILDDVGVCVEANEAACRLHGLPPGKLVGRPTTQYLTDLPAAFQFWEQMLRRGQLRGEFTVRGVNDELRYVEVLGTAHVTPSRHLLMLHDVTANKQTEEALRRSEVLQRNIIDALPAGMALLDACGTLVIVNASWRQFTADNDGSNFSTTVGKNYFEACAAAAAAGDSNAAAVSQGLQHLLAGRIAQFSYECACGGPLTTSWVRLIAVSVPFDGERGVVVMQVDTTDQHQTEDILRNTLASVQQFTEGLTGIVWAGNRLAMAPSVDELCRQAVLAGLEELGFDRIAIWLIDDNRELIRGTFGIDEKGKLRDERTNYFRLDELPIQKQVVANPKELFKQSQIPLFNHKNEIVGIGEIGAAALMNGDEVIGVIYADNLLSQQPFVEHQWRILELYTSMVSHLLSLKRTESALRSNEDLLNQILDILPVGIFVLSPEEKIIRFNRAGQEIWRFDTNSIQDWSPTAWWTQDRAQVRKEEWAGRRAIQSGESVLNQEVEIVRANKTRLVILNSAVPLRNAAGDLTGAVVINQDITQRKRREQQLVAMARMGQALRPLATRRSISLTVIDQLIELLPTQGVAMVLRSQDGRFVFEEATGDLAPLAGAALPDELINNESDVVSALRIFDTQHDLPWSITKKFLHHPPYLMVAPLANPSLAMGALVIGMAEYPDDELVQLVGALADSCMAAFQRGDLYEEVMTQARQLDRVMESVNFGLLLLDPQRRVLLVNQHVQDELSHLANVVVGEKLHELGGQKLGRFLLPRASQSRTQEITTNGRIYEITTVPVGDMGAEDGWLMVIHDVTYERSIQTSIQQHQRLAAVGQLAAGIAHDFNNIVAVILLYVQILQQNIAVGDDDQKKLLVIREQAQNASRLIRQILDFSRQTIIERQPVDLRNLLKETVTLWERTLPESIFYHLELEIDEQATVLADANSLQQALTNLAVNARDAMPNGGTLTLLLRPVTVSEEELPTVAGLTVGQWFEICVMDTGEGITPENLPHIFDPFFTTKDVGKGTGLGLAQVYGIVQQHQGLVTAQSEAGIGTSFCLFLPALADDHLTRPENDPPELSGEGTETILLVEDNAPAREATKAILEMMGYRVVVAADGRAGFDLFNQHADTIDLVVSDLVMPEMGGMELYQQVRTKNPAVSVIIMTGYPLEHEGRTQLEQDTVGWLQKPFTLKQLTSSVRQVLDRAKNASIEQEGG